jgi:hypothetical protein
MPAIPGQKVNWYRCPLKQEDLSALNRKSDLRAWLQTGGFLALLALTGTATLLAFRREPWFVWLPLLYLHGTCCNFLINGFHELVHGSSKPAGSTVSLPMFLHSLAGTTPSGFGPVTPSIINSRSIRPTTWK